MALQNIGASNIDDAFYRYKMPKMITKIESRGNGVKTNIVNNVEIAKALARPASYTTKYFGCELGAQSKFDEKTGTSIVNGRHDTAKLAELLENFIRKYVQCYGCGNPETEIVITKKQMITLECAACGFISDVDMRDKVTNFILKNPPEQKKKCCKDKKAMRRAEKERLKDGEAADEEQRKLKKETSKKKGGAVGSRDKKKNNASDEYHIQEQLSKVTADMVMLSTTEEKPKAPSKVRDDAKEFSRNLVDEIIDFMKKAPTSGQLSSFLKSSLSGYSSSEEVMYALFVALFDGVEKDYSNAVTKKRNFLAAAATEEEDSQMLLLHAVESFCLEARPQAVKEVALILKALYDDDVVEEEFVLKWYQQGCQGENRSSLIWKNAKPFVEWLQNAESETEDE